ncbi:NUDIX domain-containing protein [Streptomyces sp. NPDC047515]|uniref:NUDIX hydrolase n=1 Tax=Streptomyces sp. NPDC047515 TaxID=3155380 RepID=UPI003411F634
MTLVPPDDTTRAGTAMTDAEYGASRSTLWTGASALITDTSGRVLVQRVDYRDVHLLPGGAVDAHESPSRAAAREALEELGVTAHYTRGLAVDWIPSNTPGYPAETRFPGEILFVYDGGTWNAEQIAAVRLPDREILAIDFAEPARLPDIMEPGDARRTLSALRARINGTTTLLEDGRPLDPTPLDRHRVLATARKPQHWSWHSATVPSGLPLQQSWGWLFAPDGRVLVLIGTDTGSACLPGGTVDPGDHGGPSATLRRETAEEANARIGEQLLHLGYLYDDNAAQQPGPCARVRMAGRLAGFGPWRPAPATGHTYARLLATPEQVCELFDWGPEGDHQVAAVHAAREQLGLPRPTRQSVTELPRRGGIL